MVGDRANSVSSERPLGGMRNPGRSKLSGSGPSIERLSNSDAAEAVIAALERDGCVIVEGALPDAMVAELNDDLSERIATTRPGISAPSVPGMQQFYGDDTVRLDGLPDKSKAFAELMCEPRLLAAADHFLLPTCARYLFNTGQLIEIRPSETDQALHRDEDAWMHFPHRRPEIEVEALFALSDFSRENGGTRVAPGSHKWPVDRKPTEADVLQAEMSAGSALIYLGSVLHGGGANRTESECRRAVFVGYVLGWLRTEENSFLTVPIETAKRLPERVQQLLGYEPHIAIGVVDVGSPMKLLE